MCPERKIKSKENKGFTVHNKGHLKETHGLENTVAMVRLTIVMLISSSGGGVYF
jgi:hypothetical protein